jgi:hypothetical protein
MQIDKALGWVASMVLFSCAAGEGVSSPPAKSDARHDLGASGSNVAEGTGGSGGAGEAAETGSAAGTVSIAAGSSMGGAAGASAPSTSSGGNGMFGDAAGAIVPMVTSTCGAPPQGAAADKLIDDMEDGDGKVSAVGGRSGDWFTYHDATAGTQIPAQGGVVTPETSDRAGSTKAIHTSGSGFSDWGAGLGVALHASCPYDGSAYAGIAFYAKGPGPLTIKVKTAATTPVGEGGSCTATCYDHFKKDLALTGSWSRYEIAWTDLAQAGWGTPAAFSPAALIGVNFEIVTTPGMPVSFDFWIDDLSFL